MPTEVHDGAPGPPARSVGGGGDPAGVASIAGATPETLRRHIVAVLSELGVILDHPQGNPSSRPAVDLSGDVAENESPKSMAYPVIATGEQLKLALKQEGNRGRSITIMLAMLGLVLTGTVAACLRLPPEQSVERLTDLTNTLLLAVGVALAYYFGRRSS